MYGLSRTTIVLDCHALCAGQSSASVAAHTGLLDLPLEFAELIASKLTHDAARTLASTSTACMALVLEAHPDLPALRVDAILARIVARLPVHSSAPAQQRSTVRLTCVLPGQCILLFNVFLTWRNAVTACAAMCTTLTRTRSGARSVLPQAALPWVKKVALDTATCRGEYFLPKGLTAQEVHSYRHRYNWHSRPTAAAHWLPASCAATVRVLNLSRTYIQRIPEDLAMLVELDLANCWSPSWTDFLSTCKQRLAAARAGRHGHRHLQRTGDARAGGAECERLQVSAGRLATSCLRVWFD